MEVREHFGIVGGGLLGMTLALRLVQRGYRVTLLEAADHLGGLADAWKLGEITWDRHYHVTLLSDVYLRGILTELGLDQDMQWRRTRTGFLVSGRLHSLSSVWDFLRFHHWDRFKSSGWHGRFGTPQGSATGVSSSKSQWQSGLLAIPAARHSSKSGCRC